MARIGENYIGLYCPSCGRGLKEVFEGVRRFAECIRSHRWHVADNGETIVFRSIEKPVEKSVPTTSFCEYGE